MLLDASNSSTTLAFFPVHPVLSFSSGQNEQVTPDGQQLRENSAQRKRRKRKPIETTFTTLANDNKPPAPPSSAYVSYPIKRTGVYKRKFPWERRIQEEYDFLQKGLLLDF